MWKALGAILAINTKRKKEGKDRKEEGRGIKLK
jgi:hypothetical protein